MHAGMLERKLRRPHGRRTGRDQNFFTAQQSFRSNPHRVGIDKTGRTLKRLDVISSHLFFPAPALTGRDIPLVPHEISHGRLSPEREIHAKELARTHSRKRQRGFAQRLAWDRAGVDSRSADLAKFFHQRDALAKNPRRIRSANSRRPAADYDKIERLSQFRRHPLFRERVGPLEVATKRQVQIHPFAQA